MGFYEHENPEVRNCWLGLLLNLNVRTLVSTSSVICPPQCHAAETPANQRAEASGAGVPAMPSSVSGQTSPVFSRPNEGIGAAPGLGPLGTIPL